MNTFGIIVGFVTLLIIGLGFVWVIRGEYYLGIFWWPYFMGLGILLVVGAALIPSTGWSVLTGVFGASLVWGSTELKEQTIRTELGWFPFNPKMKPEPPLASKIKKWKVPHL